MVSVISKMSGHALFMDWASKRTPALVYHYAALCASVPSLLACMHANGLCHHQVCNPAKAADARESRILHMRATAFAGPAPLTHLNQVRFAALEGPKLDAAIQASLKAIVRVGEVTALCACAALVHATICEANGHVADVFASVPGPGIEVVCVVCLVDDHLHSTCTPQTWTNSLPIGTSNRFSMQHAH